MLSQQIAKGDIWCAVVLDDLRQLVLRQSQQGGIDSVAEHLWGIGAEHQAERDGNSSRIGGLQLEMQ